MPAVDEMIANVSLETINKFIQTKDGKTYFPAGKAYDKDAPAARAFFQSQFSDYFESLTICGFSKQLDLFVFLIRMEDDKSLGERSCRRAQYDFAINILKQYNSNNEVSGNLTNWMRDSGSAPFKLHYALFVFAGNDGRFRFSLVENLDAGAREKEAKRFRRYTFYVDPAETNKTFIDRMGKDWSSFDKIKDAFSVEKLNEEFYTKLSNWYFWAMNKVQFPGCDQTKEGNAVPLIRLITRLIFVWFMKQKGLISDKLFQENDVADMLQSMAAGDSTYYKAILQNLFFATLNTEMKDSEVRRFCENGKDPECRLYHYEDMFKKDTEGKNTFLTLMQNIPFLNGGLFSCLDDDKTLTDCFSDDPEKSKQLSVPNELFWAKEADNIHIDLSKIYDDTSKRSVLMQGLIPLLAQYNFTIDESSPNDATIALDPELLGRAFENLLASYNPETSTNARKETGSFYTPREIVDYMVEQSLVQHILTATEKQGITLSENDVNALVSPHETELPQSLADKKIQSMIIKAIKHCTILDPACGSGAFPMGLLSAFIRVLGKLKPAENDTELYNRKLELIQNCIYGVDIQPIAVQISKLRCFISLLADDDINDKEPNRGIEPLPNLEMHFVAANSLIDICGPEQGALPSSPKTEDTKAKLQKTAEELFSVKTRKDKKTLQEKYKNLREQFRSELSSDLNTHDYDKIAEWAPFNPTKASKFFNQEWMFGIKGGFDIVIGNPPYLKEGKISKAFFAQYKNSPYYEGKMDLWQIFACNGIDMLKENAHLCFIATNNWTTNDGAKKMRNRLVSDTKFIFLNDFGSYMIFKDSASIQTMVMMFQKSKAENTYKFSYSKLYNKDVTNEEIDLFLHKAYPEAEYLSPNLTRKKYQKELLTFHSPEVEAILNKMQIGASYLQEEEISQGIVPNPDVVNTKNIKRISPAIRQRNNININDSVFVVPTHFFQHLSKSEAKYLKPLFEPSDLGHYFVGSNKKEIIYITRTNYEDDAPALISHLSKFRQIMEERRENIAGQLQFYHLHWPRLPNIFEPGPKILAVRKCSSPCFSYTEQAAYVMMACNVIKTQRFNLKFLVGILNSKLTAFWLNHKGKMQGDNYQIDKGPLKSIPIQVSQEASLKISEFVSKILEKKNADIHSNTALEEQEIDTLVYKLYRLSQEEISIVENSFAKYEQKGAESSPQKDLVPEDDNDDDDEGDARD